MSRTTEVKAIPIRDLAALSSAVEALQAQGINCSLVQNDKPRMYYRHQEEECPYVLKLHDGQYDVGFRQTESGELAMIFDDHGGYVADILARKEIQRPTFQKDPLRYSLWNVMKFTQLYSEFALGNMSQAAGMMYLGTVQGENHQTHYQYA